MSDILRYHIIPDGKLFTNIIKDDLVAPTLLEGSELRFNRNDNGITVNGAELNLNRSDLRASNGVVHILEEVVYPIPVGSIYDAINEDSRFVTLVRALDIADLVEVLDKGGPYTLFAPTDAAFDKVSTLNCVKHTQVHTKTLFL